MLSYICENIYMASILNCTLFYMLHDVRALFTNFIDFRVLKMHLKIHLLTITQ